MNASPFVILTSLAALASAAAMAVIGGIIERLLLRRLAGQELAQVLLTLGFSFIIADICLMVWTGDPWQPETPRALQGAVQLGGLFFPIFRLVIVLVAVVIAVVVLVELVVIARVDNWATGAHSTAGQLAGPGDNVTKLGQSIFTRYLFPFEITSVLLVIAVIGAVVLARKSKRVASELTLEEQQAAAR